MFKLTVAVLLVALVCLARCAPAEQQHQEQQEKEQQQQQYEPAPRSDRHVRATCDLLSASAGGVSINHSACAAHCLYIGNGYKGGRCVNGVCHCRK